MTVMTHVKALEDGQSRQGTPEPITPVLFMSEIAVILNGYFLQLEIHV